MSNIQYQIKTISKSDSLFMQDMLYNAIYVADDTPVPRDIIYQPNIYKYIDNWDDNKDIGFMIIQEDTETKLGGIWLRCFSKDNKGYGFIDENIPELSIAVYPQYRGRGLGTALINHLIRHIPEDINSISLSVDLRNPAKQLYERMGFKDYCINSESAIMKYTR